MKTGDKMQMRHDLDHRSVFALTWTLLLLVMTGCDKASEKDCDQAFDHYFELKMKGIPEVIQKVEAVEFERKRAGFLTRCVDETKVEVLRCWRKANSLDALSKCEDSGKILTEK